MTRHRFSEEQKAELTKKALQIYESLNEPKITDKEKFRFIAKELGIAANTVLKIVYSATGRNTKPAKLEHDQIIERYSSEHFNPFIDLWPVTDLNEKNIRLFEERLKTVTHSRKRTAQYT